MPLTDWLSETLTFFRTSEAIRKREGEGGTTWVLNEKFQLLETNVKKQKMLQKWDARVHLTRDLKHSNPHDELYKISLTKTPKNVIFQTLGAPFFYPKFEKKTEPTGWGVRETILN